MTTGDRDDALTESPIEEYLDALLVTLEGRPPRVVRRLLAEAEAHLRDATADGMGAGLDVHEAEREAVRRFGPANVVAPVEPRGRVPARVVARQCVSSGLFLCAVGALAVGASGVFAGLLRVVGGSRFLVDVAPGQTLAPSDCARWLAVNPGALTCRQAAITDWADETVAYRIAVGLLGLVALGMFLALRRRWRRTGRWVSLPPATVDAVAAALFGITGVWLLGLGLDAVVQTSGHGAGQWLSAAPVAIVAAAFFAQRLVQDLRISSA